MRRLPGFVVVLGYLVLLPTLAHAQATLTGVVRDSSEAVLPGVSVEASSPALIERVRSAVTDGSGQYRITELPPGVYAITYTLTGFSVVKREGIIVTGSGVIPINAELRVGALSETITVTGETPVVDTQTTRRETVLSAETINALPASRTYGALLTAIPGLMIGAGNTSAMTTPDMTFFTAHGGRANEGRVTLDGLNVAAAFGGGGVSTFTYDTANAEEVQVLVSGGLGEAENGGPSINFVPRSGGNTFKGSAFYSGAGDWSRSDNIDDYLRDIGISRPAALVKAWDVNGSYGGPIKRDRLWFFGTARNYGSATVVERAFANLHAGDPTKWVYAKNENVESRNATSRDIYSFRLTAQVTARNRVSFSHEYQHRCSGSSLTQNAGACRAPGSNWIGVGTSTASPESWPGYHDFPYHVTQATWTSPRTGKLLLEAGFSRFQYLWAGFGGAPPDGLRDLIPVVEQATIYGQANFAYRGMYDPLGFAWADNDANPNNWRASAAYVTGAHNMKVGYQGSYQKSLQGRVANTTQMRYTFNNGVPVSFGYFIAPRIDQNDRTASHSLYLQDQWTRGRLTFQGAVRYDRAWSWAPAEGNGTSLTSRFNPQPISFARTDSVKGYNDITPRMGISYDLFGTGKTAVKANFSKYLQSATNDENYWANNPVRRLVTTVGIGAQNPSRQWTDNGNFVVDCNLSNPARQDNSATGGDICGALGGNNLNFGNLNPNTTVINPAILEGWGVRPSDWSLGVSVQHEVIPRVSVDVGYNRRSFQNFFVTDNQLVAPSDYQPWSFTAPLNPNLSGGGGYTITQYNITPAASARGAQNYQTFETDFGPARTQYWHGVDASVNARMRNGLTFQGGTSTGRGIRDTCATVVNIDNPDPRSCRQVDRWITTFRGLASYTLPKVDVLISASMRSLASNALAGGDASATNGSSLAANYNIPNTVVQQSLGRLPTNGLANGTTTVNMLVSGELYGPDRINQVDMRFAKILRFGRTRADLGVDLYNLFNTNDTTGYTQAFDYTTNGATWLQPTTIVSPRFLRLNVKFDF